MREERTPLIQKGKRIIQDIFFSDPESTLALGFIFCSCAGLLIAIQWLFPPSSLSSPQIISVTNFKIQDQQIEMQVQQIEPNLEKDPWTFFKPIWETNISDSLDSIFAQIPQTKPPLTPIFQILSDPRKKISPFFQIPDYLKSMVSFWILTYTAATSEMLLVHDRIDPHVLYGLIDLSPLYKTALRRSLIDEKVEGIEKKILDKLDLLFQASLSPFAKEKNLHPELLSDKDWKAMLTVLGHMKIKEKEHAKELHDAIRTQMGQKDLFLSALFRAKILLPPIEKIFKEKNLPLELARLPFVESSFNIEACSYVGAIGLWQFMPQTARQMISKKNRNHWRDPEKQTIAATKLLSLYRSLLPDWSTTVTAYNSGVGRLRKLVLKHEASSLEKILQDDSKEGLGFAGTNFYAQFLTANLIEQYQDLFFEKEKEEQLAAPKIDSFASAHDMLASLPLPPPSPILFSFPQPKKRCR